MSRSKVLEELKIKLAPYVRSAIIGKQNRLGHGAVLEEKLGENQYKINNEIIVINDISEKDFYEIAAFVTKILKQEIGGANKTTEKLDGLIAEVLHILKFNSVSLEHNLKNVIEADVLNDPEFQSAADAFNRLNEKENIAQELNGSENAATREIAKKGEYGEFKNRASIGIVKLYNDDLSSQAQDSLKTEIQQSLDSAENVQLKIKEDASKYLKANMETRNQVAARCKQLRSITKSSDKGSAEYENAVAELWQIAETHKELFENESRYSKAVSEISDLKKIQEKVMQKSANEKEL